MDWQGVVVHHSASPDVSANEIDRWHKSRGWKGIGYHLIIRKDGSIETGRPISQQGAHARGRNDSHIGVCLTGNFTDGHPSLDQINSLITVLKGAVSRFDIDINNIEKHHEECPGQIPWQFIIKSIKE